jgi:hypothetical protein
MTKNTQAFKNAERGQKERYGFAIISIVPVTLLHPSARYSLLVRQRIRVALGAAAALAAISLSPGSAQAYLVTVNGVQYDVTTFTGSYNANTSKFETAANNGVMPWFGNQTMATQFAKAVGYKLGRLPSSTDLGQYFPVWKSVGNDNVVAYSYADWGTYNYSVGIGQSTLYAQVLPAAPVPGPLPLLGAALPLSFCRRLLSRSKRLRHGASRLA